MSLKKKFLFLYFLLFSFNLSHAQLEVARVFSKDYNCFGYGGFLNFSIPISQVNYLTLEGGIQRFKDQYGDELIAAPLLAGYRYTLDQSGSGLYVEPNVGYIFAASDYDEYSGVAAGLGFGYLFDIGNVPFNVGLRYEHCFGDPGLHVVSLRIAHSLHFGRRDSEY